ncbi:MAG: hypothetical protein KGL39_52235 [Patescibacteria group bacterium]|nr:hypothetical protein [Patescibacteria group bacterium]
MTTTTLNVLYKDELYTVSFETRCGLRGAVVSRPARDKKEARQWASPNVVYFITAGECSCPARTRECRHRKIARKAQLQQQLAFLAEKLAQTTNVVLVLASLLALVAAVQAIGKISCGIASHGTQVRVRRSVSQGLQGIFPVAKIVQLVLALVAQVKANGATRQAHLLGPPGLAV